MSRSIFRASGLAAGARATPVEEKQVRNGLRISLIAILAAGLMAPLPAVAATINLGGDGGLIDLGGGGGGLLGLGGASGTNTSATVDTNNLGNGQTQGVVRTGLLGGPSDDDATATLDLGRANSATLLDLFGNGGGGNGPTTASLNLGGNNGATGNARLDIFGDGGSGPNSNVALNLLGTGGGGSGTGGGGLGGTGGGGSSGNGGGLFGGPGSASPGTRVASLSGAMTERCFLPNANQVQTLVSRHAYVQSTFDSWGAVSAVKVVDVGLCPAAAPEIVADANISRLQRHISTHAALREQIGRLGHEPADVIGMDKSGKTLVIYVM
jgi:hypothetical protein